MADIHLTSRVFETSLKLDEMAFGCKRTVSYDAPIDCLNCEGSGRDEGAVCVYCDGTGAITETRQTSIVFPGALDDGEVLELKAKGVPGALTVTVRELPHPVFERAGEHLRTSLDVPARVFAEGGRVNVETLDDDWELEVPAGSGEGTVVRLHGHGFPSKEDSERRGDLLVKLSEEPETTPAEREARRAGAGVAVAGLAVILLGIGIMVVTLVVRSNATVCESTETTVCMVVSENGAKEMTDSAEAQRDRQTLAAVVGVAIGLGVMGFGGWITSRGLTESGRDRIEQRRM